MSNRSIEFTEAFHNPSGARGVLRNVASKLSQHDPHSQVTDLWKAPIEYIYTDARSVLHLAAMGSVTVRAVDMDKLRRLYRCTNLDMQLAVQWLEEQWPDPRVKPFTTVLDDILTCVNSHRPDGQRHADTTYFQFGGPMRAEGWDVDFIREDKRVRLDDVSRMTRASQRIILED